MIPDHNHPIPETAVSGSKGEGGHSPSVDPPITTALILDPTGPGYRLDSKLVAELSAPLPHDPLRGKARFSGASALLVP